MKFNVFRKSQSGDTIVEVLIALSILGLALSIAYATANRSITAIRLANETSNATAITKSQIELLRGTSSTTPYTSFCLTSTDTFIDNSPAKPLCTSGIYSKNITQTSGVYKVETTWKSSGSSPYYLTMYYVK